MAKYWTTHLAIWSHCSHRNLHTDAPHLHKAYTFSLSLPSFLSFAGRDPEFHVEKKNEPWSADDDDDGETHPQTASARAVVVVAVGVDIVDSETELLSLLWHLIIVISRFTFCGLTETEIEIYRQKKVFSDFQWKCISAHVHLFVCCSWWKTSTTT